MDQQSLVDTQLAGNNGYAFEGQTLLIAAIATVFIIVALLVGIHLYARWCLRRGGAAGRTRVVVLDDNHRTSSAADHGLEAAVLSSLPVFHYSSKAAEQEQEEEQGRPPLECAVCLSDFAESEIVRLLPKCNHSFHIECIDMWFHSHSTCPLCRSAVEPASNRIEPSPVEVAEEVGGQEPDSSSGSGLCATCHHEEGNANVSDDSTTSLARRRKAADGGFTGVKIEVAPPWRAELDNELTQGSPVARLLSFKRLLSLGRRSPAGGAVSPRHVAGTSRGATELDLESGLGEPVRVCTPK